MPVKPSERTYDEIVKILKDHLSPKPLVTAERFRFYKRQQNKVENIMTYVAELRKLTQSCNFGGYLNDALRDQLVSGMRNENIQKRLLSTAELTLEKTVKYCSWNGNSCKGYKRITRKIVKLTWGAWCICCMLSVWEYQSQCQYLSF